MKIINAKTLTILIILASTLVVLWLASLETQDKQTDTLSVRLNAPFPAVDFAPFYVAKNKGLFEENLAKLNAKPEYVGAFGEISLSIESLASNQIDMILTSEIPAISGKAGGADINIIWQTGTLSSYNLFKKEVANTPFVSMKNVRLGVLVGSSQHLLLLEKLSRNPELEKQIHLFPFSKPTDILAAYEAKQLDGFALFSPFPEQVLSQSDTSVLDQSESIPVQVVVVARNQFITQHKDETNAILTALDSAKLWLIKNPAEAQKIVAKETGIDIKIIESSWGKIDWQKNLEEEVITDMQNKADLLYKNQKNTSRVNVKKDLIYE